MLAGPLLIAEDLYPARGSSIRQYLHSDALGSLVARSNSAGTRLTRHDYGPWGESVGATPDGPGYTGHESDPDTGLVYAQQRYYDPRIGRFLTPDPVAADADTGGNFNRYGYANNNPYRFTDPDGRFADAIADAGFAAYSLYTLIREPSWFNAAALGGDVAAVFLPGVTGVGSAVRNLAEQAAAAAPKVAARAENAAKEIPEVVEGTKVYRVWGGKSGPWGESWTTVNPNTVPDFRSAAGLPDANAGRFVSEGILQSTEGVTAHGASVIKAGQQGGLPELVIKNSEQKITLRRGSGVNPGF